MEQTPDVIPADQFVEDKAGGAPDVIPGSHFVEDKHAPDVIPADQFVDDQEKYGNPGQQILAGIEGVARGATLGGSDVAERALGLATPEELLGRREANPWTSGIGSVIGGGAIIAGTGGLAAPLEAGLGGGAAATALGFGAEGALFGAGNAVSDAALGDPTLNGEKIAAHIGLGGVLGAGLGVLTRPFRGAGMLTGSVGERAAPVAEAAIPMQDVAAPIIEESSSKGLPKTFQEMQDRLAQAHANGETFELPQKNALLEAQEHLPPLKYPLLPQQLEALDSQANYDAWRVLRESEGKIGETVQNWLGAQKKELTQHLDNAISELSPLKKPSTDEAIGGRKAIEMFSDINDNSKKAFSPLFEALDNIPMPPLKEDLHPLMQTLNEAVPSVSRMFSYGDDGLIDGIEKFNPRWGMSEETYSAMKKVYQGLASNPDEPSSLRELLNVRDVFNDHIKPGNQFANRQLVGLKNQFMDYIEKAADDKIGDLNVRQLFRDYAEFKNNQKIMEKVFGIPLNSPEFSGKLPKPSEDILGKIFKDSETVSAAKKMLAPHQFDELMSNWLASTKEEYTKNGVFSSNRFGNFLKSHSAEINEAFKDNPQQLKKIQALVTQSQIIPDAASINPSGTAKTSARMIQDLLGNFSMTEAIFAGVEPKSLILSLGKRALGLFKEMNAEKSALKEFNSGLSGKAQQEAALQATKKMISIINANIDKAASSIFSDQEKEPAK